MKRLLAALLLVVFLVPPHLTFASRLPIDGAYARRIGATVMVRLLQAPCSNEQVLKNFGPQDRPDLFQEGVFTNGKEVIRFCWAEGDGYFVFVKENGDVLATSDSKFVREVSI